MIIECYFRNKWYFFVNRWIVLEWGLGSFFLELVVLGENDCVRFKDVFCFKILGKLGDEYFWVLFFICLFNS